MSYIVFRFDIDSHVCMRQGVPVLLELAQKQDVAFTFFLHAGRAVSVWDTISSIMSGKKCTEKYDMLPAYQKLGKLQYLYAAIANPKLVKYKKQVCDLLASGHEVGLHGGMNHAKWQEHAWEWDAARTASEIDKALHAVRMLCPAFAPKGFASPGFVSANGLAEILKKRGFTYFSDIHRLGTNQVTGKEHGLRTVAVNLCGEPGGIAFWENQAALGLDDHEILRKFMSFVDTHEKVVVFDHPYVAALKKRACLERIITELKENGHCIVPMYRLAEMESGS